MDTASQSYAEVVLGRYNELSPIPHAQAWNAADAIFRVGAGSSQTARSDALRVMKSGVTQIKALEVGGIDVMELLAESQAENQALIAAQGAGLVETQALLASLRVELIETKAVLLTLITAQGATVATLQAHVGSKD